MSNPTGNPITRSVLSAFAGTPDARTKEVLEALVRHLHAFVAEVSLTEAEWLAGIGFLTRTGHITDDTRQEFILLSDVLGVTMLVDGINHGRPAGATENSVLGPFFREQRASLPNGSSIHGDLSGEPLYFEGRVEDLEGRPLAGAAVDVWHSDSEGFYDTQLPGREDPVMRGLFHTDDRGRFWLWTIAPAAYPIPDDGPVGELMRATRRPCYRPAPVHVRIEAPGYERVTTTLFLAGDPHLRDDPVFGVKESLIERLEPHPAGTGPDGRRMAAPFQVLRRTFALSPAAHP